MGKLESTQKITLKILIGFFVTIVFFAPAEILAQVQPDLERIFAESKNKKGKRPVIFIPGIMGSELINEETGEKVWFSLKRSKTDDLRLPIALNLMLSGDNLVPGDIVRKLDLPIVSDVDIYQKIVDALGKYGGYTEASWEKPPKTLDDTFFVFPYDWRRDNVETARILIEKIEALKRKTKQHSVKFDVIAHSMGGLVTRYAIMYGKTGLPKGKHSPRPNWRGMKHINRAFLIGTPNEGAAGALQTLLEGYPVIKGVNLPFIQDLKAVEVVTMPSVFQLLPYQNSSRFFDENLKPLDVDIYNIKTWEKYGWSVFGRNGVMKGFSEAELGRVEAFIDMVLKRAKRFHQAISAKSPRRKNTFRYYLVGSDCRETLDGFVIYKNLEKDKWVTLTRPKSFRTTKGVKVSSKRLKEIMFAPGDGRVTRRSLFADERANKNAGSIQIENTFFVCEVHDRLMGNKFIQNNILTNLLNGKRRLP